MTFVFELLCFAVLFASFWRVFQKMGRRGWEGIIPGYNLYIIFDILYSSPWKFFMLLIPIYGIVVLVRYNIELAHRFNRSSGFGVGMAFLAPVFYAILAFGPAQYLDGSYAVPGEDSFSQFLDKIAGCPVQVSASEEPPMDDTLE